jgi:hypothetical protein
MFLRTVKEHLFLLSINVKILQGNSAYIFYLHITTTRVILLAFQYEFYNCLH